MDTASRFKRGLACMVILAGAGAGGCAHTKDVIISEPKEVKVGVALKCLDGKDVPPTPIFPLDAVDLTDPKTELARVVNAATLEVRVRKEYVGKINEVLAKCAR